MDSKYQQKSILNQKEQNPTIQESQNSLKYNNQIIQLLNPWEIDHLIFINRLLPSYQKIVNRGEIQQKYNYQIFISYKIQGVLSSIYYCQENEQQPQKEQMEKNYFTQNQMYCSNMILFINQQSQNQKESSQNSNEQLTKFIPKIMRITPKLFQNQPIEGIYKSEYLKRIFQNDCCRYQHLNTFVKYFNYYEDDENIYTVSEQYECNLKEYLMKNYNEHELIPEDIAIEMIFQIFLTFQYLIDNQFKIIQSFKLTSILVDLQKKLKLPLISYSNFNLNPKNMPPESMKYLSPEIITSSYNIESSLYQTSWVLGVLLLDIINKGYQNGPLDLLPNEKQASAKQQKSLLQNKIISFNICRYTTKNPGIFQKYSPEFVELIQSLLSTQVSQRIKFNQLKNHKIFSNLFTQNKFYNTRSIQVSYSNFKDGQRIPFSLKELIFQ